jgi:V/A-type H+-transporting ATPase subunit A
VGAVSPPGADFSEPVTQNTLRITKVFWALSSALAYRRHFPAIDWLTSYSLYLESLENSMRKQFGPDWMEIRRKGMALLQQDEELREIVMLVGPDALSESQRAVLEAARMVKEDFFMQHAYHPVDSYCPPVKTYHLARLIMKFYDRMLAAVEKGVPLQSIIELPVKEEVARLKIRPFEGFDLYAEELSRKIDSQFDQLLQKSQPGGP